MALYENFTFKASGEALTSNADFTNSAVGTEFLKNTGEVYTKLAAGVYDKTHMALDQEELDSMLGDYMRKDEDVSISGDILPATTSSVNLGSASLVFDNIYANYFRGTATYAQYADLAEKYSISSDVEPGDVILIAEEDGVDAEVSNELGSDRVLGVVSTEPAFMMNSELADGEYIALAGRVPCKVQGPVKKGESLVSYQDGTAMGVKNPMAADLKFVPGVVFGKALENHDDSDVKLIEVVVTL